MALMSKWSERKNRIDVDSDYDPLISIPMLEAGEFDESKARRRLTAAFDTANSKNIVIIDPYLLERDIGVILDIFATQAGRNITVVTFLSRPKISEEKTVAKVAAAKTIQAIVEDINQKGIFDSFQIIVTNFDFHDRFFFCVDEDKEGILVSSGGSLSMFLTKYSALIRITNKTFKRALLQFIQQAKSSGSTLPEYILEWS